MTPEIRNALKALANGELSLGSPGHKLPVCPKCDKQNLHAAKGHTMFLLSCFRSCGFIASMETQELLAQAEETLIQQTGKRRKTDDELKHRHIGRGALWPTKED